MCESFPFMVFLIVGFALAGGFILIIAYIAYRMVDVVEKSDRTGDDS